jgi:hypothetical protein
MKTKPTVAGPLAGLLAILALAGGTTPTGAAERIAFKRDDAKGRMQVRVDGREAFVYAYGDDLDLVHFHPLLSPSGKPLTIRQTHPYPHHRAFWFADTVKLAGKRKVSFYNAFYSRKEKKNPASPFQDRIRHVAFLPDRVVGDRAETGMQLVWEMDRSVPVLDEKREMRVRALGNGEYLIDLTFTLTAAHGDVSFVSDAVHYAWPYLRIDPPFTPAKGGILLNSEGGKGQKETHGKTARWVDYSNTIDGATEGLALFTHPEMGPPPKWLTRDYGTFGPRRPDAKSGKPFVLKQGGTIRQRAGVLVHRGDATGGKVEERYRRYAEGKF